MEELRLLGLRLWDVAGFGGWAVICGALGGTLHFLRNCDHQVVEGKATGWTYAVSKMDGTVRHRWTWARDAWRGVGGALVMLGLLSQAAGFPPDLKDLAASLPKLIAASSAFLVSGFIGGSFLVFAGEKLQRDLNETKQLQQEQKVKTDEASRAATDASKVATDASEKASSAVEDASDQRTLTLAIAQLASGQVAYMPKLIKELQALVARKPKERAASILLGRAYRRQKNLDEAIKTMTNFLTAITGETDLDYQRHRADAHYNRACYLALSQPPRIAEAFQDLEEAMKEPASETENHLLAANEEDFISLAKADPARLEGLVGPLQGKLQEEAARKKATSSP